MVTSLNPKSVFDPRESFLPGATAPMHQIARNVLGLCLLASLAAVTATASEPSDAWRLADIDGRIHSPFDDDSIRAIALIFVSTDCPIANSYQPLLRRLADQYKPDGIRFFIIHPKLELTNKAARKHAGEFNIESPVVVDTGQKISRRVGATVTPQVFVFVRDQKKPAYQGRIDNLYAGYGKKRNVATAHELADALDAVLAGRAPKKSKTEAVGCYISYSR
jgi:hypothetical protein